MTLQVDAAAHGLSPPLGPCPLPPLDTYLPVMILRGEVTRGQAHVRAAVALPLESCSLCSKLPLRGSVHRSPGGSGGAEPRRPVLPPSWPHIGTQSTSGTVLSTQCVSGAPLHRIGGPPAGAAVRTLGPLNLAIHGSPDPGFFFCKVEIRIVFLHEAV